MDVPTSPEAVTPAWLTAALRSTRTLRDAAVESVQSSRIGVEAGYSGQIARLQLTYDEPPEGSPEASMTSPTS